MNTVIQEHPKVELNEGVYMIEGGSEIKGEVAPQRLWAISVIDVLRRTCVPISVEEVAFLSNITNVNTAKVMGILYQHGLISRVNNVDLWEWDNIPEGRLRNKVNNAIDDYLTKFGK